MPRRRRFLKKLCRPPETSVVGCSGRQLGRGLVPGRGQSGTERIAQLCLGPGGFTSADGAGQSPRHSLHLRCDLSDARRGSGDHHPNGQHRIYGPPPCRDQHTSRTRSHCRGDLRRCRMASDRGGAQAAQQHRPHFAMGFHPWKPMTPRSIQARHPIRPQGPTPPWRQSGTYSRAIGAPNTRSVIWLDIAASCRRTRTQASTTVLRGSTTCAADPRTVLGARAAPLCFDSDLAPVRHADRRVPWSTRSAEGSAMTPPRTR